MGQAVDAWVKTAYAVAQTLGQHRDNAVRQINAITPAPGFPIKSSPRCYVCGNIGDVNSELPPTVYLLNIDRIVKIAGIIRVDGKDELLPQVFAALQHAGFNRLRDPIRFIDHASRKFRWKMVAPNYRKQINAWRLSRAEDLNDFAFGINVAGLPRNESDYDFVSGLRC